METMSVTQLMALAMPAPMHEIISNFTGTSPIQEKLLEVARSRNSLLDRYFYNVESEDESRVEKFKNVQGSIIIVDPDINKDLIYITDTVDFIEGGFDKEIEGVSIAGVGSSAVGAVALARDLATAKGIKVAAVVSGYGLDDVVYEGLGGWFFLRETNRLEYIVDQMKNLGAAITQIPALSQRIETLNSIGSGPDLATLKSLLKPNRLPKLKWLVGHSKGNLLISSAVSELIAEGYALALDEVRIVMFGAISALPEGVGKSQSQVIGDLDILGWTNSRINIEHTLVHGAMHHLNRKISFYMDAQQQLKTIA